MDEREIRNYSAGGVEPFDVWLLHLEDLVGKSAVYKRLDRLGKGNFGDHRFVGAGVWELRIHVGPGYRVYYAEDENRVLIVLGGGLKADQRRDIAAAQRRWADYRRLW